MNSVKGHIVDVVSREIFDEIRASNDIFFSATTGYYARKIDADRSITYYVTVNRGSLTRCRDFESLNARLYGNPFIGWRNWVYSFAKAKEREEKEHSYIIK